MKLMLTGVLLVCVAGYAGTAILADDNRPTEAFPDKPSDSIVREFHSAVAAGDVRLAEKMLNVFPDLATAALPDDIPDKQIAPILTAVENGQTKMVAILLGRGATYNTGTAGATPLYRAAILGHTEIIKLLLDAGANVDGLADATQAEDLQDVSHCTPLRAALSCGHPEIARLLVQRGAQVDIYSAAGLGWTDWVAQQIKDHPEQAALADGWRYTPLCYAVAGGSAGVAEVLLSHGANINHTYDDGGTLLEQATLYGYHDLIVVLLVHGADINAKNNYGDTAVDFAIKYKQADAETLLREHGGKRGFELNN